MHTSLYNRQPGGFTAEACVFPQPLLAPCLMRLSSMTWISRDSVPYMCLIHVKCVDGWLDAFFHGTSAGIIVCIGY